MLRFPLRRSVRRLVILAAALALALPAGPAAARKKKPRRARNVEDLLIVRCALPGVPHSVGTRLVFVTPRRVIKTTRADCAIQGGQFVVYDRSDYATALEVWLPEAQEDDPVAQTYVGEIYEKGPAGTPDHAQAAKWYQKAAEQGHSRAQTNLGQLSQSYAKLSSLFDGGDRKVRRCRSHPFYLICFL